MIRSLRRRLALMFGLLSSCVLAGMLAITCTMHCAQYESSEKMLYQERFQTLVVQVQRQGGLSDRLLSQITKGDGIAFYMEIDGVPLHYCQAAGTDQAPWIDLLRSWEEAESGELVTFTLAGTEYWGRWYGEEEWELGFVQDRTEINHQLLQIRCTYVLLGGMGVALLLVISWLLAKIASEPTRKAMQEQTEFIAAASHELKSPLTVIRTSLYTAREVCLEPAVAAKLELADQEAERMGLLVGDLLTLSVAGAGQLNLQWGPVELESVCVQLYERFAEAAEKQQHPLRLELPEEALPVVWSDQRRLVQLFAILLSNALQHTPGGTEITLLAQVKRETVILSVVDHGPGIPDGQKEAVFRKFFQMDQSRTEKQQFGLGLSIARELARALQIRLTVEDTPGGGATFAAEISRGRA